MSPDLINGCFELVGAGFNLLNVHRLVKDKRLNGVRWEPTAFFTSWGVWNLFYYPALGQYWSFLGGCVIVAVNALWVALVAWYALDDQLERALILDARGAC